MLSPLTNTFGIETCCFVCDPDNPAGLRIQFFHDEEAGEVVATASFDEQRSGAPKLVHGGVLAAVCDDAAAWAAIALARRFALTAESRFSYVTPLPVDREARIRARLIGRIGS